MKKIVLVVALLAGFVGVKAQQAVGTPQDLERFKNTTTYVVLEHNPMLEYNHIIKETVEKHWTITPYEFVTFSTDDFEKARFDSTKSFLIADRVFFEKDKTKAKYMYLSVLMGGDYNKVHQMPDVANVPVAYDGIEEEYYAYKLGMLCRFLQNHIELTLEHPELNSKNILKYYYKNITGEIQKKTLYVTKGDLAKGFGMKEIKAIYPYKVELVEREDIEKAIDDKNEDIVFIHKVGPEGSKRKARCFKTIVGAADAQVYYFGWHMISDKKPEGMLKADWKKLANAKPPKK